MPYKVLDSVSVWLYSAILFYSFNWISSRIFGPPRDLKESENQKNQLQENAKAFITFTLLFSILSLLSLEPVLTLIFTATARFNETLLRFANPVIKLILDFFIKEVLIFLVPSKIQAIRDLCFSYYLGVIFSYTISLVSSLESEYLKPVKIEGSFKYKLLEIFTSVFFPIVLISPLTFFGLMETSFPDYCGDILEVFSKYCLFLPRILLSSDNSTAVEDFLYNIHVIFLVGYVFVDVIMDNYSTVWAIEDEKEPSQYKQSKKDLQFCRGLYTAWGYPGKSLDSGMITDSASLSPSLSSSTGSKYIGSYLSYFLILGAYDSLLHHCRR